MNTVLRASWYRFRTTFRSESGSYLTIALLLGLVGGLALGSLTAARRTQSSFSDLERTTNPSQIILATAIANPAIGNGQGYNPAIIREIAQLPHVTAVASAVGINAEPLNSAGGAIVAGAYTAQAGTSQGSVGGEYFRIDRLALSAGRAANPATIDEFVMSPAAAAAFGFHVGEIVPMGFYTNNQTDSPLFGTPKVKPYRRIKMRLVGIGVAATGIITDDVDAGGALGYFTPALTSELLSTCVNYTESAVQLANAGDTAAVMGDITRASPGGMPPSFSATAGDAEGKADRATRPLSIALGVFGGITALAALLIEFQVMSRYLRRRRRESEVLRALGADSATLAADPLIGIIGAVAVGTLVSVGVAVALSPLSPLGLVRPFYPTPGIYFDWTVLGGGVAVFFGGLALIAWGLAVRNSPERVARRQLFAAKTSRLLRVGGMLSLPAPAATGLRFALQSGSDADTVPLRSAITGAALAAIVLIATVTFGASLDHLVSTPRLYGWNWTYALSGGGGGGGGDIPGKEAAALLAHDRYLSAYSAVDFGNLIVDGQDIPVISTTPGASVQPPLLHGHDLQRSDEIVVGALTLASLHKSLGDSVTEQGGAGGSHLLRIVGVATMPAIGGSGVEHLEMGSGAVVATSLFSATSLNPFNDPETGPQAYLVDVRTGVNQLAAERSLEEMTAPLSNAYNFGVVVQSVLRPAEIVDYRSLGTTPAILGVSLGAGALAALALTLLAEVHRRRRDMSVLKAIGFTRSQLRAVVAFESNVAVAIGTVVGIPVGIIVGRTLWDLFARGINAVPSPVVPAVPIVLIALGALVLANVVAAIPGRIAARTPAALLMRTE